MQICLSLYSDTTSYTMGFFRYFYFAALLAGGCILLQKCIIQFPHYQEYQQLHCFQKLADKAHKSRRNVWDSLAIISLLQFFICTYTVLTDPDMILPLFVCFVVLVNTELLKYAFDTTENFGLITMLIRTEIMHMNTTKYVHLRHIFLVSQTTHK
jgi:hypothetical protein